jgi:hypothetical protein
MPIRINLLAEVQAAEELRRQDPVKRAILAAVGIVVVVLFYTGLLVWQGMQKQKQLEERQQTWNKLKPQYDAIKRNDALKVEADKKAEVLYAYSTNRWFWAPVLNAFSQVSTNAFATNLQVVRLNTEQMFLDAPAVKAVTNAAGKVVAPARSAGISEQNKLIITAKDFGRDTDANYNRLRLTISEFPFFKAALEPGGTVKLVDFTRGTVDPLQPSAKGFQNFVLQCQFAEKFH